MTDNPVLKSTIESAARAALIAAATWAGVEFGTDTIGTAASVIAVLVIAAASILWSKFTHKRNVLTDPAAIKPTEPPAPSPLTGTRIGPVIAFALMSTVTLGMASFAMLMSGCQNVGPENTITRDNTTLRNGSPVTLQIEDADKKGIASGVGPARFTSITQDEVQTMQTGTTPRDLFLAKLPDGTIRFNLSSGTDIQAEGVTFDAAAGSFRVDRFGTSASEPIRAGNEAYDRLVAYWTSLSEAQKQARLAEIDALKVTAPELADLILGIVTGL
jgi:hypothetical protein